VDVKIKYYKNR